MTHFGLVHVAGLGAWCWEQVIAELAANGCQAAAVNLPCLVFLHAVLPVPGMSLASPVAAETNIFNSEMITVPLAAWSDETVVSRFLFHLNRCLLSRTPTSSVRTTERSHLTGHAAPHKSARS